ncbi:MAG: glycosyltransferase [Vicinamibacterales bacterium]|jgi:glycosyltransferase involved in cell wall biosynthesis
MTRQAYPVLVRSQAREDEAPQAPAAAAPTPRPRASARVMQVVLSLAPGGTERLVIDICRRLGNGFDVSVCCLDDQGAWAGELLDRGIEVIALNRRRGFRPEIGRHIARLALERRIDLLHCHQYSPFVYGRLAKYWQPRLKLVYTEHGRLSDAPPSWKRRLVNPLLSRFDGPIVAVSDELRHHMIDARFPRARVEVIHNGIEAAARPAPADRRRARALLGLDDQAVVAISVARLDPVKDFPSLLEAFSQMRAAVPTARLLIVGDGPERAALETRAARPDLAGAVSFLGLRPDVRALLPAADIYVNSSISEGISITILEAMAAVIPVVATAAGGTPEVLADGATGVLVPVRNHGRLAEALIALAADPSARSRFGALGRQRVETSFTQQRMVAEYAQLYRRLLD